MHNRLTSLASRQRSHSRFQWHRNEKLLQMLLGLIVQHQRRDESNPFDFVLNRAAVRAHHCQSPSPSSHPQAQGVAQLQSSVGATGKRAERVQTEQRGGEE